MNNNNAEWIWYPGELETYLNIDVVSKAYHRSTLLTPLWRTDTCYVWIHFRKEYDFPADEIVHIEYDGEVAVQVDGSWQLFDKHHEIPLPKGKHVLNIKIFNRYGLPALYIDHPVLKTNSSWIVNSGNGEWVAADCNGFCNPKLPPASFQLERIPVEPVTAQKVDGGMLYDFGKEIMAYICVDGSGKEQFISLGESKEEALDYNISALCFTADLKSNYVCWQPVSMRFVFLPETAGNTINRVWAQSSELPIKNKGNFSCNDELLNEIYNTSVYTLKLCSREFFLDGIKRDRWVWSGDATLSYLFNFYSFNDNDICRRTMTVLRGKDPVTININTIQDYTCFWFISLYDYYLYTGDTEYLKKIYSKAVSLMDFCFETVDENGFFNSRICDWVFIDWADMNKEGILSIMQILFARALQSMSVVARVCGNEKDAVYYEECFNKTLSNCFKYFWNNEKGCFMHDNTGNSITRYANMFALLYGFLNDEQKKTVVKNIILNPDIQQITTPYMKFYELMALSEAGDFENVVKYIRSYWGDMIKLGATSFWEEYKPEFKGEEHLHMYSFKYIKSLCHAWGAGPIVLFLKYIIGVFPTSSKYETFAVKPALGGLTQISGTVPTPSGNISVEITNGVLKVKNDSNGTGCVEWCGKSEKIAPHSSITM